MKISGHFHILTHNAVQKRVTCEVNDSTASLVHIYRTRGVNFMTLWPCNSKSLPWLCMVTLGDSCRLNFGSGFPHDRTTLIALRLFLTSSSKKCQCHKNTSSKFRINKKLQSLEWLEINFSSSELPTQNKSRGLRTLSNMLTIELQAIKLLYCSFVCVSFVLLFTWVKISWVHQIDFYKMIETIPVNNS